MPEAIKILWIGTGLAVGFGVVMTLIAGANNISKWGVCGLVVLGGVFFSVSWMLLEWGRGNTTKLVLLHGVTWAVLILLGVFAWPKKEQEQGFNVRFKTEFVDLSRNTDDTALWALHAGYGQTISPVSVLAFLEVTNLNSHRVSITSYSLSVKTEDCGWIYLSPIPAVGNRLLWGYMGIGDMSLIDVSQALDQQFQVPLESYTPKFGLMMFDTKVACPVHKGSLVQFKLELVDSSGKQYTFYSPEGALRNDFTSGSTLGEANFAAFNMLGYSVDASRAIRRMWSDPMPAQIDPNTPTGVVIIRPTGRAGQLILQDGAFVLSTQQRSMQ